MSKAVPPRAAEEVSLDVLRRIRIPFIQRATLTYQGQTEELFLVDLGLSGAFAERQQALPVGAQIELSFALPGNEILVRAGCRVAWWLPPGGRLLTKSLPAGLGLEFQEISEADRTRLQEHLEEYLRRDPALRRFHRPRSLTDDEGNEREP